MIAKPLTHCGSAVVLLIVVTCCSPTFSAPEPDDDDDLPLVVKQGAQEVIDDEIPDLIGLPAHGRLDEYLSWKLEDVDRICRLTDDQNKKLQLAGQGDIQRLLDRIAGLRSKSQSGQINDQFDELIRENKSLKRLMHSGPFEEHSLFAKTQRRILTAEQLAKLEAAPKLSASTWIHDFTEAEALALKLNRPLVAYFQAQWCGPCQQMNILLREPAVLRSLHRDFVAVDIDIEQAAAKALLKRFEVTRIPCTLIITPDGEEFNRSLGVKAEHEFLGLLRRASKRVLSRPVEIIPDARNRSVPDPTPPTTPPS